MSMSRKIYVGPFALVLLPLKSKFDAYELTSGVLTDNSSRVTKKQYCLTPNVERDDPPREFLLRKQEDEIVQEIDDLSMAAERSWFTCVFAAELEMIREKTGLEVKVCWGVVTWTD